MSKKFTCPRRQAEGHASADSPLRMDGPMQDEWRKDGTCSYDGSVSGERFLEYVKAHKEVGSTDKGYKFYLPDIDAEVHGAGKFYTHHLSPEQSNEFYDLWVAGRINFGQFPPYVRLYLPGVEPDPGKRSGS